MVVRSDANIDEDDILNYCEGKLARFKLPKERLLLKQSLEMQTVKFLNGSYERNSLDLLENNYLNLSTSIPVKTKIGVYATSTSTMTFNRETTSIDLMNLSCL